MDKSLKIQLDVKNNVQDLQSYVLDLNNWEEEMKKKELELNNEKPQHNVDIPPPRNTIKRSKPENGKSYSNKPKKISGYDYSAWDKFDVDKACAEIDEEDFDQKELETEQIGEEENSEEEEEDKNENDKNTSLIDEAFYEKELGNQFVKKEQWNDAIKCYTNAIKINSKNAIFYANRSLCFLKLKNFKAAEVDATVAIQLDKDYVKAYQRRAFSRLALGQVAEAKLDYEEVLRIEPKNALARVEIDKINDKLNKESKIGKKAEEKITFNHKDLFKSEEKLPKTSKAVEPSKAKAVSSTSVSQVKQNKVGNKLELQGVANNERIVPVKEEKVLRKEDKIEMGDGDKQTSLPSNKTKVFAPLPDWCRAVYPVHVPPHKRSKKPLRKINIIEVDKDDPVEFEEESTTPTSNAEVVKEKTLAEKKMEEDYLKKESLSFEVPKTSIQFRKCWDIIKKCPEGAYSYVKKIPPQKLPKIFENSLESDFFSELVTFLANDDIEKEPEFIYNFLIGLSFVKRFTSLVLFMSENDRTCVKKCIDKVEKFKSKEDITELYALYEL